VVHLTASLVNDADLLINRKVDHSMVVEFPNGTTAISLESGTYIPAAGVLPVPATVFKDSDIQRSLVGLSDFCRDGQEIRLTEYGMDIIKAGEVLLHSEKLSGDKLWSFPRQSQQTLENSQRDIHASSVVRNDIQAGYVKFWSAALGSSADDTLIRALAAGYLGNLPRLTARMVRRHRPNSLATAKGHLDRTRQGIMSTKPRKKQNITMDNNIEDLDWESDLYTCIVHRTDEENHSDLSGKFPITSIHGNNYMLMSVYKNHIRAVAMKSKEQDSYLRAYRETYAFYKSKDIIPKCQRLDNETSTALETFFREEAKVDFQYVPPKSHRRNKAERAMRTMKNHLIATYASADANCPLFLWDEAIAQANITVNLLRPWADDPTISAYEGVYKKPYDFLANPIAPFGTAVLIYETPEERKTWADHGVPGFYLGPTPNSYRTFRVYVTKTRGFRDAETLAWFPESIHMPGSDPSETLLAAIEALNNNIKDKTEHNIQKDYLQLSELLRQSIELFHGSLQSRTPTSSVMDPDSDEFEDIGSETGVSETSVSADNAPGPDSPTQTIGFETEVNAEIGSESGVQPIVAVEADAFHNSSPIHTSIDDIPTMFYNTRGRKDPSRRVYWSNGATTSYHGIADISS
jgi:hypothetical protein